MFKQIVTAIALTAALSANAQDSWTGPDKAQHVIISAGMGAIGTLAFQSKQKGFYGCMAVGVGKEIYDARTPGHKASAKDLFADAVGCAAGAYIGGVMIAPTRTGVALAYATKF